MGKIKTAKHDSVKMYKIRKMLAELGEISGHGTELISVYIPKGKQLHEIISILREEQGTADHIKSDLTRTHVVDSLGKVIQRLRLYKKTPERGLVIFSGAIAREGGGPVGTETIKAFEIDPPKDLKTFLYRCDDHFHTDILKKMLVEENLVGFLALDAKDTGWGILRGDRIEELNETGSGVAGKHRQGGQSAKRFQKLREMELTYYYNRIAAVTKEYFLEIYPIKALIVSGPGPTKEEFINGNYLEYRLQKMIIATLDTSYAGKEGIREAFTRAGDILSDFRMVEEKKLVEKLFRDINSHSGLGAYGVADVMRLLEQNIVDTLIVTDDSGLYRIEAKCAKCGKVREELVEQAAVIRKKTELGAEPCPGCGGSEIGVLGNDIVDHVALVAARTGSKVEVISGKTEHGTMLSNLGKMGAILRYNPSHTVKS